jgi:hypothetical protein
MLRALMGVAFCVAVCVSGSMPTDIVPVAHEVSTVKPAKQDPDDDCVPSRLIRHPSGAIIGEEECPDGSKRHTRLK